MYAKCAKVQDITMLGDPSVRNTIDTAGSERKVLRASVGINDSSSGHSRTKIRYRDDLRKRETVWGETLRRKQPESRRFLTKSRSENSLLELLRTPPSDNILSSYSSWDKMRSARLTTQRSCSSFHSDISSVAYSDSVSLEELSSNTFVACTHPYNRHANCNCHRNNLQ